MSRGSDVDDDDPEYATAVAAAAYAITSLEETRIPDQTKKSEGPESAPIRVMSKKSAMAEPRESDGVSMRVPAPNLESGKRKKIVYGISGVSCISIMWIMISFFFGNKIGKFLAFSLRNFISGMQNSMASFRMKFRSNGLIFSR